MVHTRARSKLAGPRLSGVAFTLGLLCGATPPLHAQAGTVTGEVIETKAGRPLMGAVVRVEQTGSQATTDARGHFTLRGLSGDSAYVTVVHIGYQPRSLALLVDGPRTRIELTELAVRLEDLVVTGTVEEAATRSIGNVVGKVDVTATVVLAPPTKVQDLLSVSVPGVRVIRAAGTVGAGGRIRIRGVSSLSLSSQPLLYIDGIRVYNEEAVLTEAFQIWSGESPSRINDLNPEEIESIEILKGPSAATIYGTEASNGVIQVLTRKGKPGRPQMEVHMGAGANWLMDPVDRYGSRWYLSHDGTVKEYNVQKVNLDMGYPPIFSTGVPVNAGASLSGGSNQIGYFLSGDFHRNEGMLSYDWQNKYNVRANIGYRTANDKFKVEASLGVIRSKTSTAQGYQPVTASLWAACPYPYDACDPDPADPAHTGVNGPGHGFAFYRPEDYSETEGLDFIDRTTFSLTLRHQPLPWLRHHLTVGPDLTNNNSSDLVWRHFDERRPFFDASEGRKTERQTRTSYLTIDYGASGDWRPTPILLSTTSVGVQYYYKQLTSLYGQGLVFAVPGPGDITGAAQRTSSESFLENKTFGVFVQEQLSWKNRGFLTAALRADDNSAFGKDFTLVYYPKLSLSWVLSEEPFLANKSWLPQLRVRTAWGRAGQQPDVFSAARTYQAVVGHGGAGMLTPQNFGNTNLKPEVGQEFEVGFDAGLWQQRVGLEFTWYDKTVKDAILSIPLKPSEGFPGSAFVNLAQTRNKGVEVALDVTPVLSRNVGLDLRFTLAKNQGTVEDMGGQPPLVATPDEQFYVPGFAPGSWFLKRVVSSTVVKPPGEIPYGTNIMCEGGTDLGAGNGTTVPCESAPRIYAGQPTPTWSGSGSLALTLYSRLHLLAVVDLAAGNVTDVGDVGGLWWLNTRAVLTGESPIVSGYYGLWQQGYLGATIATQLTKTGFARLRTVSASYEVPGRIARWVGASRASVTVSAENLAFVWRAQKEAYGTKWIDPEVHPNYAIDGSFGLYGYTQESFPQTARVVASIRLAF